MKKDLKERTPGKQTVELDREVLRPWRDVAKILGVSLSEYLEAYLADIGDCVEVHEEIADITLQTRVEAERIAARLEKFSVEAQLSGSSDIGTVAASVAQTEDGRWRIKVDLLGTGKDAKWRRISLLEERHGDDSGDEWKGS